MLRALLPLAGSPTGILFHLLLGVADWFVSHPYSLELSNVRELAGTRH